MQKIIEVNFESNNENEYYYTHAENLENNQKIIATTSRGVEVGSVLKYINEDVMNNSNGERASQLNFIERLATDKDLEKHAQNRIKSDNIIKQAKSLAIEQDVNMKLVDAHLMLDGQKVVITFTCEDRVDFREFVKKLANVLKLRIELKQIGIRDQAKIVGGVASCGQQTCCSRFLNDFDKVSIKMAKTQNLSLNPLKLNGLCGRLMCCLSYENDYYAQMASVMPKLHSRVSTPSGDGVVIYNNIFTQFVSIKVDGDEYKVVEHALTEVKFDQNNTNKKPTCETGCNTEKLKSA